MKVTEKAVLKPDQQNTINKYLLWLLLCTLVFVLSTFVHECGHGLSSVLAGQPVSTGFNRVGNVFMFPRDSGFRTNLNLDANSLTDIGVPATLLLAIAFTILYCKHKFKNPLAEVVVLSIAVCNSMIRLIPALLTCLIPLATGKVHMEDELQTGTAIQKIFAVDGIQYVPVLLSIAISSFCLWFVVKKVKRVQIKNFNIYNFLFVGAYVVSFIIENVLDNILRINWIF